MSKTIEEEYIELAADYGIDVSVPERFYESQKLLMVRVIKHVHRLDDIVHETRVARNERSTDCDMKLTDVPGGLGDLLKTFSNGEVKVYAGARHHGKEPNIKSVHNMGNCVECSDHDEIEGLTK